MGEDHASQSLCASPTRPRVDLDSFEHPNPANPRAPFAHGVAVCRERCEYPIRFRPFPPRIQNDACTRALATTWLCPRSEGTALATREAERRGLDRGKKFGPSRRKRPSSRSSRRRAGRAAVVVQDSGLGAATYCERSDWRSCGRNRQTVKKKRASSTPARRAKSLSTTTTWRPSLSGTAPLSLSSAPPAKNTSIVARSTSASQALDLRRSKFCSLLFPRSFSRNYPLAPSVDDCCLPRCDLLPQSWARITGQRVAARLDRQIRPTLTNSFTRDGHGLSDQTISDVGDLDCDMLYVRLGDESIQYSFDLRLGCLHHQARSSSAQEMSESGPGFVPAPGPQYSEADAPAALVCVSLPPMLAASTHLTLAPAWAPSNLACALGPRLSDSASTGSRTSSLGPLAVPTRSLARCGHPCALKLEPFSLFLSLSLHLALASALC